MTDGSGRGVLGYLAPLLAVPLALGLLIAGAGCTKHGKAAPVGGSDVPPSQVKLARNVEVVHAEQRALDYFVETVGYLEAENQTDIAAGAAGVVDEVLFREGQRVDRDTVLVKIDQRRYLAAKMVAEANVLQSRAKLAQAERDWGRARHLGTAISQLDYDTAQNAYESAKAETESARASLDLAMHYLDRSQVRAPYAGQINQRRITPGSYVEEKTVVATIADLRNLRLVGYIPEKAAPMVHDLVEGQERLRTARLVIGPLAGPMAGLLEFFLDARGDTPSSFSLEFTLLPYPQHTFHGRVFYLSTTASPDTHMFECKAQVTAGPPGVELRPGFTARIRCPLRGNPSACVVPEESVRASERGFIAFVPAQTPEGWVADARTVELGYRSPGWVEVLQGIRPGELVVRRGAEALEKGTPIEMTETGPWSSGTGR